MFHFKYVDLGAGLPPAPIVMLTVYPPEWERATTGELCYSCTAFLDTGSDCTLLPLEAISVLNLTTFKANAAIVGVGGGQMQGLGCYVDLGIGTRHFAAIRAYACGLENLNGHAIIGRDVLNQCLVEFDGLVGEVRL
ncbi:Retroviral aspartyl protease [Chamaesiphon minutus]|uniref:Retroviral aspartyl protease n=1 Tax=Chamaesiphon minutus (strain ATCC 27169 / PCC 6605) TaxID=1173020 RepID=K9ULZ4_CHAP6|nr:Retroviral aspartyl protease [Chamaesiphon minutus]AFY95683.1 Retroviral aspartyl protease [Chamaesiphon minutus PCC 6605]